MASATPSTCSDIYSDLLKPREQSRAHSMPPTPGHHKRVDSTDFIGAGALFNQNGKQLSWPRPPKIEISLEEVPDTKPVPGEMTTGLHQLPARRPGTFRRHFSSAETHLVSTVDVAALIEFRDSPANRANAQTHSSSDSQESNSDRAASTVDDRDIQGHRTPPQDLPTHIASSRPNTPPPPSVINTEDEHHDDTFGPTSPDPWTQYNEKYNEKKRKRSDNGEEDEL